MPALGIVWPWQGGLGVRLSPASGCPWVSGLLSPLGNHWAEEEPRGSLVDMHPRRAPSTPTSQHLSVPQPSSKGPALGIILSSVNGFPGPFPQWPRGPLWPDLVSHLFVFLILCSACIYAMVLLRCRWQGLPSKSRHRVSCAPKALPQAGPSPCWPRVTACSDCLSPHCLCQHYSSRAVLGTETCWQG